MKGGSVSVTARQQTYRASNFEQGGGGSFSISSEKGKIMERFNCKETAGETLERLSR